MGSTSVTDGPAIKFPSNKRNYIWMGYANDNGSWYIWDGHNSKGIIHSDVNGTNTFFGNAASATKLKTARTISLTGSVTGSGSFDGSGNLSITTTTNHSHSYLPLSGGTMTGVLTMKGSMYTDAYTGALNMNNSNIYGLNGIYTADSADNASEGINFYRSTTTVDSLWAKSGILYFTPNRTLGENGTSYTVLHTGNYTSTLDSRYLKLSGGTMTGTITSTSSSALVQVLNDTSNWRHAITWRNTTQESGSYLSGIGRHNTGGNSSYPGCIGILPYATNTSPWDRSVGLSISKDNMFFEGKKFVDSAGKVYGAVWNDYAEFRTQNEEIEPGYCVTSSKSGKVYKTTERLQYCEGIVSDTYGFSIGETDNCKTPLAVSGRVLAYYDGDISDYEIGDAVCATVNGLITKMTREEIKEYPDRIVGTVSEIPSYDTWGSGNASTAGRIWIKVR